MAPIQAISVGRALNLDAAGSGAVHSVFARAVNLMMQGEMWTLLAEDKADLPFGIRVALLDFAKLRLHGGDLVNVRSGFVGVSSRLVFDCRAARRWTPAWKVKPEPGLARRLAIVARAARGRSWHESAAMAQALRAAVSGATALDDALVKVVGRGPGATPSGDDVLIGVLAVLTSPHAGKAGARVAELLRRALLPLLPTTTQVSGHMLRHAMDGRFGSDMHELVNALIGASSPRQLSEKTHRVIQSGATSGADACEGLLAFAPSYFPTRYERASA